MEHIFESVSQSWGFALAISLFYFGLTKFALGLLSKSRKETLALFLLGAERNWASNFCSLFDSVFGGNLISIRFLLSSALISICSVLVIWFAITSSDILGDRIGLTTQSNKILIIGIIINTFADIISNLETRYILGKIEKNRSAFFSLALLFVDATATALTIIILLSLSSTLGILPQSSNFGVGETVGLFSIYSIFFLSTFVTSLWLWGFAFASVFFNACKRLFNVDLFDVEGKPDLLFSFFSAIFIFFSVIIVAPLISKGSKGASVADFALCTVFSGEICARIYPTTTDELWRLRFLLNACEGGVVAQCLTDATDEMGLSPESSYELFDAACNGGHAGACRNVGAMHFQGLGATESSFSAANYYERACNLGDATGCASFGHMLTHGMGRTKNEEQALSLLQTGCDAELGESCAKVGAFYETGLGVDIDLIEALKFYAISCDLEYSQGCVELGRLYKNDSIGALQSYFDSQRAYSVACDLGNLAGCIGLGDAYIAGSGVTQSYVTAVELYETACGQGNALGCVKLGHLHHQNLLPNSERELAVSYYDIACTAGSIVGCANLGIYVHNGWGGLDGNQEKGLQLIRSACHSGLAEACSILEN